MRNFSVIIPTFNRGFLLPNCIASLRSQNYPQENYEIILIDNNSSDNTAEIIQRLNQEFGKKVNYILETRAGLMHARHAGAWASNYDFLAYTDDDALAHPDWLKKLDLVYSQMNADCVGGKIDIRWDHEPDSWVIPLEYVLGRLDYGPKAMLLKHGQSINGGNFSISKDCLFKVGGFNPDQIGDNLVGDGETGLCKKIHQGGWKMAWSPDALIWHLQFADRNGTLVDLKRRFSNNGVCFAYQYYRQGNQKEYQLYYQALLAFFRMLLCKLHATIILLGKNDGSFFQELNSSYYFSQMKYFLRLANDRNLQEMTLRENWINE